MFVFKYLTVQVLDQKRFTHNNTVHCFTIYRLLECGLQPSGLYGREGDLLLDGHFTWIRYSEGWIKAITGEDDHGRVRQRHPKITGRCLIGTEWKLLKGKRAG